jgi:DNA-binding NarL/FixJ family response regulator
MWGSIDTVLGSEWSKVLTPRERDVVLLVARGLSNNEVARELGLSVATVEFHMRSIFQKLTPVLQASETAVAEAVLAAQQRVESQHSPHCQNDPPPTAINERPISQ